MALVRKHAVIISDIKMVAEYLAATRNEIAHDNYQMQNLNTTVKVFPRLPRPAKWIGLIGRQTWILAFIYTILSSLWSVLAWVYFQKESYKWWMSAVKTAIDHGGEDEPKILAFSERCIDVVFSNFPQYEKHKIFLPPWVLLDKKLNKERVINISGLLDENDRKKILRLSMFAHHSLRSRIEFKGWGLQSYTAWRWFYIRLALEKLHGKFIIAEHFDRWAVLADRVVRVKKLRGVQGGLKLIQHGSVNARTSVPSLNFYLPVRLQMVDELAVYSAADERVFKEEVIFASEALIVEYFTQNFEMTGEEMQSNASVLFVGHPLCEVFQVELINRLNRKEGVRILYKPHPAAPESTRIKRLKSLIICSRYEYPRVSVVVSYPSTLIDEYASVGVSVVEHSMSESISAVVRFEKAILQKLESK